MKIYTNKSIWRKIVIFFLIILLLQAIIAKPVHADVVEFGGKLMSPILSLVVSIGDGIMDTIGRMIMGATSSLYEIEMGNSFWETLGTILVFLAAAALAILAIVFTAGLAAVALAAVGITATVTVGMGTIITGLGVGVLAGVWFNDQVLPDDLYLPMYTYSAEEIFKGNILMFDVNFFDEPTEIKTNTNDKGEIQYYYYIDPETGEEVKTSNQNSAAMLTNIVSTWYNALRNICLVLMLSVLVYIGIRMLLSTVAADKSKYVTMLKDWFIGLCLLFLMHYIMALSVALVEKLTDVVKAAVDEKEYVVVMQDKNGKLSEAVDADHLNQPDAIQKGADGNDYLTWPTNLMGSLRLQLQMEQYGASYVGLSICFIMLCLFTLYFTVIYLKRVLHMAFLTLIAPMVALTYCIDKLNDGQAQGFNRWFKEYIFNLLIQPMHLLLYYILVTSAFELASQNVLWSIVALGFMIPAEKLLRSLFGFEKAQTAPAIGPAGAMLATTALSNLLNRGKRKGKEGNSKGESSDSDSEKVPMPRQQDVIGAFQDRGSTGSDDGEDTDPVLDRYRSEGYGRNSNGEYFNPWTDEYDPNYDPHNDDSYAQQRDNLDTLDSLDRPNTLDTPNSPNTLDTSDTPDEPGTQENRDTLDSLYTPNDESNILNRTETPIRTSTTADEKEPKMGARRRIRRTLNASWAAQKALMRSTPQRFKRKIENSHPLRRVGSIVGGAAVGTAVGSIALAAAATTGDLGNVAKTIPMVAATGLSIKPPMQREDVSKAYNDAYNSGQYKIDSMNDYVKNYRKDPNTIEFFEQRFGKKQAKEMLKEGGEVSQYLNYRYYRQKRNGSYA